ncbi:MAG TPA: tetratricopeptide repeat protein [Acidisarcina sp.]|nr:tetratricopeptide repeat protein [Acidisarcina sp.]
MLILAEPSARLLRAQQSNPATAATSFVDLQRTAAAEMDAGKNAEAIRDTRRALEIRPDWREGWWNLGTLQYETNQYVEAAGAFRKVIESAPGSGTAWALLGLCEFELKDYATALSHLEKAQSLGVGDDPEIAKVSSYHLALLRIHEGDFERGRELLDSAFGQSRLSPQVKLALGLAMLRVPILPEEMDPSKDAVVRDAGEIASSKTDSVTLFPKLIANYPSTPYLHYEYGLRLKDAGRWKEALVQQHEEVRVSPLSALPWIEISALQLRLKNAAGAVSAAEKAVVLEPGLRAAHNSLSAALESSGNRTRAKQERDRISALHEESKVRDPRMISLYAAGGSSIDLTGANGWRQGLLAYSAGNYSEAIAELKQWLRQNAANGTGWAVLGLSEFALKDYENAQIHLERGEQLGLSGSVDSLHLAKYTLGVLLVRSGEFSHASDVLMSAVGPGNLQPEVRFASGLALLRMAKLPDAVEEPQRELVNRAGGIAELLHESKYDQADVEFESLLKQYPTTPFLHYAYGTALLSLSQYDEAAAQMRAESVLSPTSELPFIRLASIALRKASPSDAIAPAERAVQLADGSAEAHYLLGRAALSGGDTARSIRELEIACTLAPGSPEAHFNLAKAYAKAGQPQRAAEERATFVRLNAVAEEQKSQHGSQAYQGPREARDMSAPQKSAGVPSGPN